MLVIPTVDARPGMSLAAPVPSPDNPEQVLLHRGYVLEQKVIDSLTERGIYTLYVAFPALDFLDRHLEPEVGPERQALVAGIKDTFHNCQQQSGGGLHYHEYVTGIRAMTQALLTQGPNPYYLDQMSRMGERAVAHSAAVAHLSLLLGLRLEAYLVEQRKRLPCNQAKDVANLGVGAMLHDVGKARLPKEYRHLHETGEMLGDDRSVWEEHVRIGYELIHDGVEPSAATAVLHHHQHFDGSGHPHAKQADGGKGALEGQKIHIFARIVLVADLFDHLVHVERGGRRRTNLQALHELRRSYSHWCDPVILRGLMLVAPPFPPGTRVQLNDGSDAVVTGVDPTGGCQPIVQRFIADGKDLDKERLDLRKQPTLSIRRVGEIEIAPYVAGLAA